MAPASAECIETARLLPSSLSAMPTSAPEPAVALMDRLPGFMWQNAGEVAAEGIAAVERGEAVHVTGRVNRFIKSAFKLMPDRLALRLSARQARRYRQAGE